MGCRLRPGRYHRLPLGAPPRRGELFRGADFGGVGRAVAGAVEAAAEGGGEGAVGRGGAGGGDACVVLCDGRVGDDGGVGLVEEAFDALSRFLPQVVAGRGGVVGGGCGGGGGWVGGG